MTVTVPFTGNLSRWWTTQGDTEPCSHFISNSSIIKIYVKFCDAGIVKAVYVKPPDYTDSIQIGFRKWLLNIWCYISLLVCKVTVLITFITLETCNSLRYETRLSCPDPLGRSIMKQVRCNWPQTTILYRRDNLIAGCVFVLRGDF